MKSRRTMIAIAFASSALIPACNPYQNFDGEFYAGPIDPTNFQAPYVGTLPGTADQEGGTIAPIMATVKSNPINYYLFPFSAAQTASPDGVSPPTPLTLDSGNVAERPAYVFDPTSTSAFPSPAKCTFPKGYLFDQRTEAYRKDEQGVIFTDVPSDAAYVPVVAEVPVTSNGENCQDIKSSATAKSQNGKNVQVGKPDGKYLAFAIVDPGADVQPDGANGLGPQHWGWYNKYLVAFIDGGYIPTVDVPAMGQGSMMVPAHTDMKTQKLYTPTTYPGMDVDKNMNPITIACPSMSATAKCAPAGPGNGLDVLEAARGDANYSPVCEVWTYTPDSDKNGIPVPETDATKLTATEQASAMFSGTYVYCFQTM